MGNIDSPGLVVFSISCSAGIARNSANDVAPILLPNCKPDCSASKSETVYCFANREPLSPIAAAIIFFDKGEAIKTLTE